MLTGSKPYMLLGLLVLVVAVGAYAVYQSSINGGVVRDVEEIAERMGEGEPMRCTFAQDVDGVQNEGVSYVAGERMRGDYVSYFGGQRMESGMFTDGVTMYTWSESPMGVMGTMYRLDTHADDDEQDGNWWMREAEEFGFEEGVDYECEPWRVDESIFRVPDGIEFMDMTDMMQPTFDLERDGIENLPPAAPSMDDLPGLDCSICYDLPEGPREACLESLMCVE